MKPPKRKILIMSLTLLITLLASCTSAEATEAPAPSPTIIESSPTPEPTEVLVASFEVSGRTTLIQRGSAGQWDSDVIRFPYVVEQDGVYHMFFEARAEIGESLLAIGYASSTDGTNWTKHGGNPIFEGDGTGFDSLTVARPVVLVSESGEWIMYYTGSGEEGQSGIGRATADSPEGPWQREPEPILSDGPPGSWDDELILADQIVATEDGFLMYYSGRRRSGVPAMIGLATSDDGLSWEKYRDASGSEGGELYAESDPILLNGTGWDFGATWTPNVFQTDEGWIMFYNAFGSLGLAFSDDGIIWTRSEDNPIYTSGSLFHPFVVPLGDDSFQIYFRNLDGETIDVLNGTLVIP